jgi:hypothetical protein
MMVLHVDATTAVVKIASEYDLGFLARSYTAMAGHFVVEPLRPLHECDKTNVDIGDPVGLTRLLLVVIGNRDGSMGKHVDCCVDAVWIVGLKASSNPSSKPSSNPSDAPSSEPSLMPSRQPS